MTNPHAHAHMDAWAREIAEQIREAAATHYAGNLHLAATIRLRDSLAGTATVRRVCEQLGIDAGPVLYALGFES